MSFARVMLRSFATVALASGLALTSQLATAANDGLPDGSWRQSCQNGQVSNGVLYAQCRREDGRIRTASATIGSCLAFGSRNGELFCEKAGDTRDAASGWGGSFRDTCTDISVDKQGKLKARCLKDNGTYQSTNLSMWKCLNRHAVNRDGRLVCDKSGSSKGASKWDGSFRNSCRDISADSAGTLTATCRAANGSWRQSSLSARQCNDYRAANRDGTLVCETSDSGSVAVSQWQGSFRQSCRDITADSAGTLTATCQTVSGGWHRSSLSLRQCSDHRAGNRDGTLFCESPDSGSVAVSQWQGSFRQSCRDITADSAGSLTANCQAANGSWHRSTLSLSQCNSHRAGNRDGTLVCELSDGGNVGANQWQGSFRQSCRDISADSAGTLTATCQAANGSWHRSSLSRSQCISYRAGNRDGTLVCESQDGGNVDANQWQGSFRQSCRDISADSAGTLTATCQTMSGSWHRSSLSRSQCNSYRAGNRDGTLVCESQEGGNVDANQWQGSFRQSCRDISADSAGTLTATCQTMSGSWHRSSLSRSQCNSYRAGNRDGNLFCEG